MQVPPQVYHVLAEMERLQSSPAFKSAMQLAASATRLVQNIEPLLDRISEAARLLDRAQKVIEERETMEGILLPFRAYQLWPAPSMSTDLLLQVGCLYETGKGRLIPARITQYYKKQRWQVLENVMESWQGELFLPRHAIIREALWAHKSGKFGVSVPSLLPHIEGIARELCVRYNLKPLRNPLVVKDGSKTHVGTVFSSVIASWLTGDRRLAVFGFLYYLEGGFYAWVDFESTFENMKEIKESKDLNRHAILHGIQLNYNTELNSLRCFLVLDVLSMLDQEDSDV